jgi:hypothetical protein
MRDDELIGIDKFVYNPLYVALVVFVVVPINLNMMMTGQLALGLVLLLMQVPWASQGFFGKFEYTARCVERFYDSIR